MTSPKALRQKADMLFYLIEETGIMFQNPPPNEPVKLREQSRRDIKIALEQVYSLGYNQAVKDEEETKRNENRFQNDGY